MMVSAITVSLHSELFVESIELLKKAAFVYPNVVSHFDAAFKFSDDLYEIEALPKEKPLSRCTLVIRPSKKLAEFIARALAGELHTDFMPQPLPEKETTA